MVINMIVCKTDDDVFDICAAWDEWAIDANYEDWEALKKKYAAKWGEIRVLEVEVPDDTYVKLFVPNQRIKGKVRENSEHQE